MGVLIDVLGGALLAAGFMTRYCAAPMLILSAVVQFDHMPLDNQLFGVVLCGLAVSLHRAGLSFRSNLFIGETSNAAPILSPG